MFSKQLLLKQHTYIHTSSLVIGFNVGTLAFRESLQPSDRWRRMVAALPWLEQLSFGKHNKPVEWMGLACQPHIIGYIS